MAVMKVGAKKLDTKNNAPAPALPSQPLYAQARDALVRGIVDGKWKPGDYLPSELQLATDLGISVGTIRRATEDLVARGVLERQHGRGTQIVPHTSDRSRFRFFRFTHADGRPARLTAHLVSLRTQVATKEDQARLDLDRRDEVIVLTRYRRESQKPLIFERIAVPKKRFGRLDLKVGQDMLEELYVVYQKQCGASVVKARDELVLDRASTAVAKALNCEVGHPALLVKRTASCLTKKAVEFRQSWTVALRYISDLD